MKTHTYTALLSWSLAGHVVVPYIRRQGGKRNLEAKTWPAEVRSYLLLDHLDRPHKSEIPRDLFDALEPKDEILRVRTSSPINRLVTFTVPAPPPPEPAYLTEALKELDAYGHLNWTVGNEDWTACFDAVRAKDKIVYHVVVNCESGGFIDTIETNTVSANAAGIGILRHLPEYWVDICNEHYMDSRKREHRVKVRETERTKKAWQAHLESLVHA